MNYIINNNKISAAYSNNNNNIMDNNNSSTKNNKQPHLVKKNNMMTKKIELKSPPNELELMSTNTNNVSSCSNNSILSLSEIDLVASKIKRLSSSVSSTNVRADMFISDLERNFSLSIKELEAISEEFTRQFNLGLKSPEDNQKSDLAMLVTYISKRPTGDEKGTFYAIDFGGTNIRFCKVTLNGNNELDKDQIVNIEMEKHTIPENLKVGSISIISTFIAQKMKIFFDKYSNDDISSNDMNKEPKKVGFTFSFPLDQVSANKGLVLKWSKEFDYPDSIGKDIVKIIQDEFNKLNINCKITAVINDTVGTLLSSTYHYPNSLAGLILGTGTNACYYENIDKVEKLDVNFKAVNDKEMIINTEWGNFDPGCKFLKKTEFDDAITNSAINKEYVFEKMVSGRYLGEIVRIVLFKLKNEGVLFNKSCKSEILETPYMLNGAYLKRIEDDVYLKDLEETKKLLEKDFNLQGCNITVEDCFIVKKICETVSHRSARLTAAALTSLCKQRIDLIKNSDINKKVTLGIDGSLYNLHTEYRKELMNTFKILMKEDFEKVELVSSNDGSSVGAALAAMLQN